MKKLCSAAVFLCITRQNMTGNLQQNSTRKGYTFEKRKGEESMKSIDVFCHLMPQKYAELAIE